MRFQLRISWLVTATLLTMLTATAQILSGDSTKLAFSPTEKLEEVTWSPNTSLTNKGLFIEKMPSNQSAEIWVMTQPISAGMSWHPPSSINISVALEADAGSFSSLQAFFRYSGDRVHWSTWYNLSETKKDGEVKHQGSLSISNAARKEYETLQREWWKTSPAWSSDEHELSLWIAKRNPDFFATEFPFIGYIQVRLEGRTQGMRLQSLTVDTFYGVGGLTSPKKRATRTTTGEKWFFDLSKITK